MAKKKRGRLKQRKAKELDAQQRVELILKVRSGQCTVTDAAAALGVSRKTYYQWETRALAAMLGAVSEKEPGRPALPPEAEEVKKLREKVEYQKEQLEAAKHRENLIRTACDMKLKMHRGLTEKKHSD